MAHGYATARQRRERRGFRFTPEQWRPVISLLKEKWSPEQISSHLRLHGPFSISHETIYRYVLSDKKEGGTLFQHLRIMPKIHRKRYNSHDSRGILPGKRHISERPAAVETRKQLGHWEADTVIGSDLHHCILTLVERKSGLAIIRKLSSRTAACVTAAALPVIRKLKPDFRTITFDNGTEFHDYKALEARSSLKCFLATPLPLLGAGQQREPQRPDPPVPPEGDVRGPRHPGPMRLHRPQVQHQAAQTLWLQNALGGLPWELPIVALQGWTLVHTS